MKAADFEENRASLRSIVCAPHSRVLDGAAEIARAHGRTLDVASTPAATRFTLHEARQPPSALRLDMKGAPRGMLGRVWNAQP